ncbi:hypothetical protein M758_5G159500 [Ceratodon purpureus]|uniref:Uncharacterized protein n=1 Tax=Ceratodon purpureus TaxID=3225 RepID=A0A8T0I4V8_CERPU|nr:hypothetical protein KC19_5G166900 [Ceratodon purpureus]KAG0617024.1 hypothetical protein M758_5G159500 [Ceratodon purpureus]
MHGRSFPGLLFGLGKELVMSYMLGFEQSYFAPYTVQGLVFLKFLAPRRNTWQWLPLPLKIPMERRRAELQKVAPIQQLRTRRTHSALHQR